MNHIVGVVAVSAILACAIPLRARAEGPVQDARTQKGKVWYEQYCTPCHGSGGAPGSAVFPGTKTPVDLRTISQRNDGHFPSVRWWQFVFSSDPRGVHAKTWERIRSDQTETIEGERDIPAHGVVATIEYYVESIQTQSK